MRHRIYHDLQKKTPPKPDDGRPSLSLRITQWALIVIGVGAIAWMVYNQPAAKHLVCDGTYSGKLTQFGTCHNE